MRSDCGVAVETHTGKCCRHCSELITGSALVVFRYRGSQAAVEVLHFHKRCIEELLLAPTGMMKKVELSNRGICPQCEVKGGEVTFVNRGYNYGNYHKSCIQKAIDNGNWTTDLKFEHFVRTLKDGSFEEKKAFFKEKAVRYIDALLSDLKDEEFDSYLKINSTAKKRVEKALMRGDVENLESYVRRTWRDCSRVVKIKTLEITKDLSFYNEIKEELFQTTRESLSDLHALACCDHYPLNEVFKVDYKYLFDTAIKTGIIDLKYIINNYMFYDTNFGVKYFSLYESDVFSLEEEVLTKIVLNETFKTLPNNVRECFEEAILMTKEGERILSKSF